MNFSDSYFLQCRQDVECILEAIEFLGSTSKQGRDELVVEFIAKYKKYDSNYHKPRFQAGLFDNEKIANFSVLLKEKGVTESSASNIFAFNELMRRLESNGLISQVRALGVEEYNLHSEFRKLKQAGLLGNLLFGIQYTLNKYLPVIPAINVTKTENGDQHCGTGIVVRINPTGKMVRNVVITNRHVVDPNRFTIDSVLAKENAFEVISDVYLCSDDAVDLAAFEVKSDYQGCVLSVGANPTVLDKVLTVGYPRVPFTIAQYALGHQGEVNGEVSTMNGGKLLVISCNVNPGNSGGPVIGSDGRCVGMVTESLFESPENDSDAVPTSPYNCAITAGAIKTFIAEYRNEIR